MDSVKEIVDKTIAEWLVELKRESKENCDKLLKYALDYLYSKTDERLTKNTCGTFIVYFGRNVLCNMDSICIEGSRITGYVSIGGYVGRHKEIHKICEKSEDIKEIIDIFIEQAGKRTKNKLK